MTGLTNPLCALVLVACPVFIPAPSQAEPPPADLNGRALQELYGGLVTDQTISIAGQDFYKYFVAAWRDLDMSEHTVLAVHERPSARWGNLVWIERGQTRVFQATLPASRAAIRPVAENAAELVYQNLVDAEVQRLMFRDLDLGPDEL